MKPARYEGAHWGNTPQYSLSPPPRRMRPPRFYCPQLVSRYAGYLYEPDQWQAATIVTNCASNANMDRFATTTSCDSVYLAQSAGFGSIARWCCKHYAGRP